MTRSPRPVSFGLFIICLVAALFLVARQPAQMPGRVSVIVDTDCGTDDLVAIAYLLARPDVEIQTITTVNGVAHAEPGARNVLRLLRVANRRIDVYVGEDQPLEGRDAFPQAWRQQADEMAALPGAPSRRQPRPDAVSALLTRLRSSQTPVTLLALGPLTNIAAAVQREPRTMKGLDRLIIMGGAVDVPGNASEEGTAAAEWNMFIDPTAASVVFRAGLPITLVPLDATNKVPIDRGFVSAFTSAGGSPLGTVVGQLLDSAKDMIDAHAYYAWDPLAAAAVTDEGLLDLRSQPVEIVRSGDERGRTRIGDGDPNADVAYGASAATFRRLFFGALIHK